MSYLAKLLQYLDYPFTTLYGRYESMVQKLVKIKISELAQLLFCVPIVCISAIIMILFVFIAALKLVEDLIIRSETYTY